MAPAAPAQLPSPPPITERIALGALTHTFPPGLVDQAVRETGRAEQRHRLLPARVVVYFVLALALYSQAAYEEVMRCLVEGWAGPSRPGGGGGPGPGGMCRAPRRWRRRASGGAPSRSRRCSPRPRGRWRPGRPGGRGTATGGSLSWAGPAWARPPVPPTRGWGGPRGGGGGGGARSRNGGVMVRDGPCLDVPDSPANQGLGRSKSGRGEGVGAFPQVRVVGLVEAGTHAIVDAVQGPYWSGEQTLTRELLHAGSPLGPGVLLLADRLFVGHKLWRQMASTGADLVWRVTRGTKTAPTPPVDQVLSDGSWRSRLGVVSDRSHHRRREPITVRVIEYTLSDSGRRTSVDRYRLVTTILDPELAPAAELAALYTERWEIETALAELKTTQRGPKQVLRSRSPELVAQEVWAYLLVHYALRQ